MDESIIIRATKEDKASLKLAANQRGVSMSWLVRELLISEKIISPTNQDLGIDF